MHTVIDSCWGLTERAKFRKAIYSFNKNKFIKKSLLDSLGFIFNKIYRSHLFIVGPCNVYWALIQCWTIHQV